MSATGELGLRYTPGGLWYAWAMASPKITHYKILHCVSLFVLKLRNLFIISFYFFIKSVYTTIFIKKKIENLVNYVVFFLRVWKSKETKIETN